MGLLCGGRWVRCFGCGTACLGRARARPRTWARPSASPRNASARCLLWEALPPPESNTALEEGPDCRRSSFVRCNVCVRHGALVGRVVFYRNSACDSVHTASRPMGKGYGPVCTPLAAVMWHHLSSHRVCVTCSSPRQLLKVPMRCALFSMAWSCYVSTHESGYADMDPLGHCA